MHQYLTEHIGDHYGDIASVAGLVISIVGFAATILGVRKARHAAEEARQAAKLAVSRVNIRMTSDEITATIELVRVVEKATRGEQWEIVTSWSVEIRAKLTNVLESLELSEGDAKKIVKMIRDFVALVAQVEGKASEAETKGRRLSDPAMKRLSDIPWTLARIRSNLRSRMES